MRLKALFGFLATDIVVLLLTPCKSFNILHQGERNFILKNFYRPSTSRISSLSLSKKSIIDYQGSEEFGRGESHLSADLYENDLVVFQSGTWLVDGVEVGDGSPPLFNYAQIDSLQVVWTHNCEHGVIRGFAAQIDHDALKILVSDDMIEFGPEQLVARVPVEWENDFTGVLEYFPSEMINKL